MQSSTEESSFLEYSIDQILKACFLVENLPDIDDISATGYKDEKYHSKIVISIPDESALEKLKQTTNDPMVLSLAHQSLGTLYIDRGFKKNHHWDFKQSGDYFKIALAISFGKLLSDKKINSSSFLANAVDYLKNIVKSLHYLGLSYYKLNKFDEALYYFNIELKIRVTFLELTKTKDGILPKTCFYIGLAYKKLDNLDKAIDYFYYGRLIAEDHYGHRHPVFAMCQRQLGSVYLKMGDHNMELTSDLSNGVLSMIENAQKCYSISHEFLKCADKLYKKRREDLRVHEETIATTRNHLLNSNSQLKRIEEGFVAFEKSPGAMGFFGHSITIEIPGIASELSPKENTLENTQLSLT